MVKQLRIIDAVAKEYGINSMLVIKIERCGWKFYENRNICLKRQYSKIKTLIEDTKNILVSFFSKQNSIVTALFIELNTIFIYR